MSNTELIHGELGERDIHREMEICGLKHFEQNELHGSRRSGHSSGLNRQANESAYHSIGTFDRVVAFGRRELSWCTTLEMIIVLYLEQDKTHEIQHGGRNDLKCADQRLSICIIDVISHYVSKCCTSQPDLWHIN